MKKMIWPIQNFLMLFLIQGLFVNSQCLAVEAIEIPEEELARESVLPVFDEPDVVKNRNVSLANRLELGLGFGTNVNEAFYDQLLYGLVANYHFTEMSSLQIMFNLISANSSQYVPQLNEVSRVPLRYERLPKPRYFFLASYEFTPFYGKISITKQSVVNLTTFVSAGAGMFAIGDSQTPLVGIGIGQNFFFGPNWGMKLDLRSLIYSGIDPTSKTIAESETEPKVGDFGRTTVMNFTVSAGLMVLL